MSSEFSCADRSCALRKRVKGGFGHTSAVVLVAYVSSPVCPTPRVRIRAREASRTRGEVPERRGPLGEEESPKVRGRGPGWGWRRGSPTAALGSRSGVHAHAHVHVHAHVMSCACDMCMCVCVCASRTGRRAPPGWPAARSLAEIAIRSVGGPVLFRKTPGGTEPFGVSSHFDFPSRTGEIKTLAQPTHGFAPRVGGHERQHINAVSLDIDPTRPCGQAPVPWR